MRVTFYGVRGSTPAPGPDTARYGGNTSCVEVRLADDSLLVLDAGTGMRKLGGALSSNGGLTTPVHLLLSHTHWDHVLGLPFFAPLWKKTTTLKVFPLASEAQERFQRTIFDDIHFPVSANDVPATIEFVKPEADTWRIGTASIRRIQLNHPGGAQGFRIDDDGGASLAYLTDNELSQRAGAAVSIESLARFADGVELLIHDAQYLSSDMPEKHGWGHSVVDEVLRLGALAKPKTLVLFHHDPDRSDAELDAIGERAAKWLAEHAPSTQLIVAQEGALLKLNGV
jgi:phosphoribosyl 1,2-cyclic phosphodiesterase